MGDKLMLKTVYMFFFSKRRGRPLPSKQDVHHYPQTHPQRNGPRAYSSPGPKMRRNWECHTFHSDNSTDEMQHNTKTHKVYRCI